MVKDILQDIIANKQVEVAQQKQAVPLASLIRMSGDRMDCPTRSMRRALRSSPNGIIAEFKRKSPSKGWLHPDAKVENVIPLYEKNGAAACSILTDSDFFGGSLGDLTEARQLVGMPLLRKDFIIDEYQLFQSRIMGADAVLLIASCLTKENCCALAETARSLSLEVLLEIHSEEELDYMECQPDLLGVNNRNLGTFDTDVENAMQLIDAMQQSIRGTGTLLIAESGIRDAATVGRLKTAGFRGFLIGEAFMKQDNPGDALASFISQLPC